MNGKWTFNEQDDGCWNHDDYATKEEAINAAREYLCDDQPVMYVGQCKTVPLPTYVDVDFMFEQLNERYAIESHQFVIENIEKVRWEKGRGCRGN